MGYFSKYLNRGVEYQGPPSWASDTDQYEKAHTVGLKHTHTHTHTHKTSLAFFRIDHVCMRLYRAMIQNNETDSSDRGTGQYI